MKQPNIDKDVILLIDEFKTNKIAEEDLEVIAAKKIIAAGHIKR